jgi:tRNA threonylcarbamoyl adenosine modification protein (Sua5/YciO/YrdC/YwlC family)
MAQYFTLHETHPQPRLISQAVAIVRSGGLIAYPTDSCYALGCAIGNKPATERITQIRRLDERHNFTLVCRDLSELATYARVDNAAYRLLKAFTPGPYTFILKATREVPRRVQNARRRTIGIRVPDNVVANMLLDSVGEPLMSSTLLLPGAALALTDPLEILARLGDQLDLVIDGGSCGIEPTTVVDLTEQPPRVLRKGLGDASVFAGAA